MLWCCLGLLFCTFSNLVRCVSYFIFQKLKAVRWNCVELIKKYIVTLTLRKITATAKDFDDFCGNQCDFIVESVEF